MGKAADNHLPKKPYHNLRFERKFVLDNADLERAIESLVFTSEFGFKEVFERRKVNNIYFDDANSSCYYENVSGDGWRRKYRIRWYGDDFFSIRKPTLEIKKKFGEVGDKISFKMPDFEADLSKFSADQINTKVLNYFKNNNSEGYNAFLHLSPKLYNSYERRYFLSFCERFRITLDYNMEYYNPNYGLYFNENMVDTDEIILELKYETQHDGLSRVLSQKIYERLSKNSKYVRGVDLVYH